MKSKLAPIVFSSLFISGLGGSNAYAQSSFAGFYGQVSTGYEGNQLGTTETTIRNLPNINTDHDISAPSQNIGGAP